MSDLPISLLPWPACGDGGQTRIPCLYERVIPTSHPFDRGLHTFPSVPTFVTSGLGEIGLPLRFLNPPVIDILEIE